MKEQLEAFVILSQSAKYYKWLKTHPKEVSLYRIGRAFEYATMKKLRSCGYYCKRSFGSKGVEDIVAVRGCKEIPSRRCPENDIKEAVILFVQCKYSRFQDTTPEKFDLKGLIKLAEKYGGLAIFAGVRNRHMYFMIWNRGWKEWNPN